MPIYEYVCPECDLKFEKLRPLSQADTSTPCPRCQQPARRVMSRFASFTKGDNGQTAAVGGSSCAGCSATDCSTCGG